MIENDPNESLKSLLLAMADHRDSNSVCNAFDGLSDDVKSELERKFFKTGEKLKSLTMNALLLRIVQLEAAIANLNRKDQASGSSFKLPIPPSFTDPDAEDESSGKDE